MNSRLALADAGRLIGKLVDRTREGKIAWTVTTRRSGHNALEAALEGGMKVIVWLANREVGFTVALGVDEAQQEVEAREAELPETDLLAITLGDPARHNYDFPEEEEIYKGLVELHELARRSAYRVDARFEEINNYLDRIAG